MSVYRGGATNVELALDDDHRLVIRKRATEPAARARLRHEHAVLDHLRHPGVVAVASFTDDSEATVLTLQWAGPRTLSDISSPTIEEAAGAIAALAATVADAHDAGIVHGRLDPSHVIIDASGRPVLCGWGGATFAAPGVPADGGARPADDVASIGQLLTGLVGSGGDLEPIPERWRPFRRQQRWLGYQRRALLTLADQAVATDARVRPTARRLAAAIIETIPGACAMPVHTEVAATSDHDDAAPQDELSLASSSEVAGPAATEVPVARAEAACDPHSAASPHSRSEPATNGGRSPTASSEPESIDPHHSPSAGVIGSPSEPPADRTRTASPHRLDHIRVRLGQRWRGRHGRRPRWMPFVAVSVVAVLIAAVIATLLRGGPSMIRSGPRRAGDAARPAPRAVSGSAPRNSTSSPTAPRPAGRAALSPSGAVRPSGPTSTATSLPPSCHPPSGVAADVDGDGCPEPVRIVGNVLITPLRQLAAGQRGDQVVLGDWWCRGRVTPAVLRPTTGEVFVFARWPQAAGDITVTATTTVTGATGIDVDHRDRCDVIRVQRSTSGPVDISVPREGGLG